MSKKEIESLIKKSIKPDLSNWNICDIQLIKSYLMALYEENEELKQQKEFLIKRDNKCQILEQVIKEAKDYLEYYLIDNLRFEDSQEEFKKLFKILSKGDE